MADGPRGPADASKSIVMILAHGSEATASGADQARRHADTLRQTDRFERVIAAFLRDTPSPADVLADYPGADVYVVPFMAGEGYSLDRLIPDALREGATTATVRMCRSVGSHPAVPRWAFDHLEDYARGLNLAPDETSVLIAAHGTDRNPDNFDRAMEAVAAIRARGFADQVHAVFLDQEPRVRDWEDHVRPGHVLVLPYLMALGRHGLHDIPKALGIRKADFADILAEGDVAGPFSAGEHTIHYGPLLGACPLIPEVIAERVEAAIRRGRAPGSAT